MSADRRDGSPDEQPVSFDQMLAYLDSPEHVESLRQMERAVSEVAATAKARPQQRSTLARRPLARRQPRHARSLPRRPLAGSAHGIRADIAALVAQLGQQQSESLRRMER